MPENKPKPVADREDQDFLTRWSRRKHAQQTISTAEKGHDEDPQSPAEVAELPGDEDMPAVETLTEESDYTGFLSPNVSEELRSLALRKLFHSAAFNVCDGLDDYAEDFTSFAKLGNVITADMRHQLQEARKKLEQQLQAADDEMVDRPADSGSSSVADSDMEEPAEEADDEPVEDDYS